MNRGAAPGPEEPHLHEMDPTGRFSDRAGDYVRFRPDYPAPAWDAILASLGDPARLRAADVGAGTGISARALAERGVRVVAIEPNAAMRQAAAPHPRVAWLQGTAEATGLQRASVDLVLVAQAFHWFRQADALHEFHRVLRPRGRLALLWNSRDREDLLTRGFIEAIHAVNGEHPAERREIDPGVVAAGGEFAPVRFQSFAHAQRLDREGLIGRATSASYVPRDGSGFESLRDTLERLVDEHRDASGFVTMRYVTKLYLTERLGD